MITQDNPLAEADFSNYLHPGPSRTCRFLGSTSQSPAHMTLNCAQDICDNLLF